MTSLFPLPPLLLLDGEESPLATLARWILRIGEESLPNLSRFTVLFPDLQSAPKLRRHLARYAEEMGFNALIAPEMDTLVHWSCRQPLPLCATLTTREQQELILAEVLLQHRDLYGKGSPWTLAQALLDLFAELTLNGPALPDDRLDFNEVITKAYGGEVRDQEVMKYIGREATLVHTLWHAWNRQSKEEGTLDTGTRHLLALAHHAKTLSPADRFILAGFTSLAGVEREWLRQLQEKGQACLAYRGPANPLAGSISVSPPIRFPERQRKKSRPDISTQIERFFELAFEESPRSLLERARELATEAPESPLAGRFTVFEAVDGDEEARGIDIQIRRWLLEGLRTIGIVTENRRLARQVRALLEQGGIPLVDNAGWALSTTRAAATLERWLQAIEESFDHRPLLDFLKSPFLSLFPEDRHISVVHRFEQDVIRSGRIARGLERYRHHLTYRRQALPEWASRHADDIENLLERLEQAAAPLSQLLRGNHSPDRYLQALALSMERLGIIETLAEDEAGATLLQLLSRLQDAAHGAKLPMQWKWFRNWLGNHLERAHFAPTVSGVGPVQLMSLEQSTLEQFDALVIASAESAFLPGMPRTSPFFNDAVRAELGLATERQRITERFSRFRSLLSAAPRVLFTLRREEQGEPVPPSPWLEAIRALHRLTYRQSLEDDELPRLVLHPRTLPIRCDTDHLPAPHPAPAPSPPSHLLPTALTAGAYQRLIDCPYQFFVAHCLRLTAPEPIREALAKTEFGEKIHRCLEAFHRDIDGLPGPFPFRLEKSRCTEAARLLEQIGEQVFAQEIEDNFLHRGWLHQWRQMIPSYIEWERQRAGEYQVRKVEWHIERPLEDLSPPLTLKGRLDRLDENAEGRAIVDYKTGSVPRRDDVLRGESVQLPFYALLMGGDITRCEYLYLSHQVTKSEVVLAGEELESLYQAVARRLKHLVEAMRNGASLPAWGDEQVCERCHFGGVCRYQFWDR